MKHRHHTSLFQKDLVIQALRQAFVKLNPQKQWHSPVMFTVEIGATVMLAVCIWVLAGEPSQGSFTYNFVVFLVLLITLLFANFAEALAEARGKAQAASLRKAREETPAKKIGLPDEFSSDEIHVVPSSTLKKGDIFICE